MLEILLRTLNRKATSWRLLVLSLKANTVHKHSRFRPEVVITVSRHATKQLARLEEKNPMAMKEAVSTCGAFSGKPGNELDTNAVKSRPQRYEVPVKSVKNGKSRRKKSAFCDITDKTRQILSVSTVVIEPVGFAGLPNCESLGLEAQE